MNPNYQQVSAINPSNPQNDAHTRVMRTHNTFPMSYQHALTCRFADETPFYVFDSESNDKVPFSSFHELRSYTLSSQFLDKLNMHKSYFAVPYKAILPNTWDLFYVPPTQGDDVPDNVSPYFSSINEKFSTFLSDFTSKFFEADVTEDLYTPMIKGYILLENFFSDGSLLSYLGCKLNKYFVGPNGASDFESFSDKVLGSFKNYIQHYVSAKSDGSHLYIATDDDNRRLDLVGPNTPDESLPTIVHRALEFCRENPDFRFIGNDGAFSDYISSYSGEYYILFYNIDGEFNIDINISRCAAYQLAYFHYLTNDKVDFIYSADLFRNTMLSYASLVNDTTEFFVINGNRYMYDWCANIYLDSALLSSFGCIGDNWDSAVEKAAYIYINEFLTIRKSLKFGDYFTGSRPRPYAVGDMTAPVVGNGVSAIDMTRNIMAQRFLNAVNKTGRKLSDYMKGIRGANTMPLLTDPKFLARDTTTIGTMEVENTAENQGNVVSLLRAEQSKYAFEADIEDPCIILGIVSFSIPRMYCRTIDRFFFKKEREDYFNPYFQNIGDQEIYTAEKNVKGNMTPFAYTLRHMEYKQRYPIASGGVVDYLKSWFFVADDRYGEDGHYPILSPEFIRSHNSEFDRFYQSLNGLSLSSYFHFIIRFVNESSPNRNMEYSPTIL